ncbi:MAG: hypothetical protein GX376_08145 [Firmicutes bacterium]|nr:hypothetical protein [Bacillota bacterium]
MAGPSIIPTIYSDILRINRGEHGTTAALPGGFCDGCGVNRGAERRGRRSLRF